MGGHFLTLSLFIVLLSFFIVLTTLSSFDSGKTQPVIESVQMAFSSNIVQQDTAPAFEEGQNEDLNKGDALDRLKALFAAELTGLEPTKNRLGTKLHVRIPLNVLEDAVLGGNKLVEGNDEGGDGTSIADEFLPTLISLVKSENTGVSYRMDMILNVLDNPAEMYNDAPAILTEKARKIAKIAQVIELAGLSKKLIKPGIGRGTSGQVDLYFSRYVPFNPLPPSEKPDEGARRDDR